LLDRHGAGMEDLQRDGLVPATLCAPVAQKRIVMWAAQSDNYLRQWSSLRNNLVHSPERLSDEDVELALDLGVIPGHVVDEDSHRRPPAE